MSSSRDLDALIRILRPHRLATSDASSASLVVLTVAASYVLYQVVLLALGLYRRHLHPLRRFPGRPEACVSTAWAYNESLKGFPEKTFEALHKQYNTKALRIGPNELHISDVELYKVIYKQIDPFPKYAVFYDSFNTPHTVFAETDPARHKIRRRLLNPMFSRAGVFKLEPVIRDKLTLLMRKVDRLREKQDINVYNLFRIFTTEVITQYAFARSAGMIEEQENTFNAKFLESLAVASHGISMMYEKPWLRHLSNVLPRSLTALLSPEVERIFSLTDFANESTSHWRANGHGQKKSSYPVVFDGLGSLTASEMSAEAVDLVVAGSDTTASSATSAVIQILTHPEIERKLVDALDTAIPSADDLPPLVKLEEIDYLNACVKECIRFTSAVPGRLPRVVPAGGEPFIVDGQVVPPGNVVSMSAYTMHTSVDIWGADARSFNPDRWLAPDAKRLEQYQVAFSKGSRMCIGQNLAPAELLILLAHIFRKYKLSLSADFRPPPEVDVFTLEYGEPGVPIKFALRA
ncbi:Benzoate 4-monooxygenase 1 [Colletotrichum chlorophyti]|uniref:Benzoate 4-monooxygenase 1 n=1 Tax=Colletotrichum chlorophyti TaxID=708187 RepID=A0A1Q8RL69_9PEZI|nr:Benzoate 4-monooxygenase 1 [Colletotrichum chlorophyti]